MRYRLIIRCMTKRSLPTITKANKLIEASYKLTLAEQRVLLALLTQVNSHPDAEPITSDTPLVVTAGSIADLVGLPLKQAYELLASAVEKFAERWVIINNPDPEEPELVKTRTRWVTAIDYLPDRAQLRTYFAPKIIPYVTHLSGEFTSYRLKHVACMNSVYAIRLYELLIQWQSKGEREVKVDWLKEQFQIPSKYPRMYDFKKRVLQPAVDQINEHSNLWVLWSQRKIGRNVVALQFQFGVKKTKEEQPTLNHPVSRLTRDEIAKHAHPGETWEQATARLKGGKSV